MNANKFPLSKDVRSIFWQKVLKFSEKLNKLENLYFSLGSDLSISVISNCIKECVSDAQVRRLNIIESL